jgi:hypothetical protein
VGVPDEECPKGGVHGWHFDAHLDGEVYRYCWKCGTEVSIEEPIEETS